MANSNLPHEPVLWKGAKTAKVVVQMLSARISYGCHFSKRGTDASISYFRGLNWTLGNSNSQSTLFNLAVWERLRGEFSYAPLPPGSFVQKCETSSAAAKAAAALKCFCKEEGGRERFSYPPHFPLKNLLWLAVLKMTPWCIFAEKCLKF